MIKTFTLKNGLQVVFIPLSYFQSVVFKLFVLAGSRFENNNQRGAAHFLEHLSFTKGRSFKNKLELSQYLDKIGARANASTGRELVEYSIKIGSGGENLSTALSLLKELTTETDYTPEIFSKEKKVIKQELEASLAKPAVAVFRTLDELTWSDSRFGQHVIGDLESLENMKLEHILQFRDRLFLPNRTVLAVGGNFNQQTASSLIKEWGRVASGDLIAAAPTPKQTFGYLKWIEHKDDDQARFAYYFKGVSTNHPQRRVYSLLSAILGRGLGSRLFQAVREREGLAYRVNSFIDAYSDSGIFGIRAEVKEDNLLKAVRVISREFQRIKKERVSEDELRLAKQKVKSSVALDLETPSSLLNWFAPQFLLKEKVETYEDFCQQVDRVKVSDLQKVAQGIFVDGQLNFAFTANADYSKDLRNLLRIKTVVA